MPTINLDITEDNYVLPPALQDLSMDISELFAKIYTSWGFYYSF